MHNEKSPLAGKTVRLKSDVKHFQFEEFGGSEFVVEDWWDRIAGKSWMFCDGNPAAMIFGMRSGFNGLPDDDEVLYGHVGAFGHLVHISEIETEEN